MRFFAGFVLCFSLLLLSSGWAKDKAQNGWEAYAELQNGNVRFSEGKSTHPRQSLDRRAQLAEGQEPHTVIVSCSDSRTPPEQIFDQGLGDIFSVRLAGNVLNSDAIASIEYAVEHFGVGLIVVMGHESCGAVKAALDTKPGTSTGSPHMNELIAKIRPHITEAYREDHSSTFRAPVKANIKFVANDLVARSKIVREAVKRGQLIIAQAIYSLNTGHVDFWDVGAKQYVSNATTRAEEDVLSDREEKTFTVQRAPRILQEKVVTEKIVPERMPASEPIEP